SDGHVAKVWRHVRVDGHADQVLEAARALSPASSRIGEKLTMTGSDCSRNFGPYGTSIRPARGVPMSHRPGHYSEYPQHHPHDHGRPLTRRAASYQAPSTAAQSQS